MTTFPSNLRRLRHRAGLTQAALALALDVHRNSVAAWEHGTISPPVRQLEPLAKALGVKQMGEFFRKITANQIDSNAQQV